MENRIIATTNFTRSALAVAVLALLLAAGAQAQGGSGAIFTTDSNCNVVNENHYPSKDAVYINGGPHHPGAAALPDGFYHVKVTTPSGILLGTSVSGGGQGPVRVVNGSFVACYQLTSILFRASNGQPGYDDTTNPGGEYKVWVSQNPEFPNNLSKTDNFKVLNDGTGGGSGGGGGESPAINHPPTISVPGPQTIPVGQQLMFKVTASDQDNDKVTLTAGSMPQNSQFNGQSGMFQFTPVDNQAGQVFVVTFTATDTKGASANGSVQITVTSSSGGQQAPGPVISVPPGLVSGNVGSPTTVPVTATSPNSSCSVKITVSGPPNVSFDESTGELTITPTEDQVGSVILITITATDCAGQVSTATLRVLVRGQGSPGGGNQGPGHLCVPITRIFFCETEVDSNCGFVTITLTNEGGGMLNVRSINLEEGTHFRFEGVSSFPMSLQSAGVVQLKIMFTPKGKGKVVDNLIITTDDPDNPTVTIQLRGKGVSKE